MPYNRRARRMAAHACKHMVFRFAGFGGSLTDDVYIVMAYVVMAYVVMAYIVMACKVMARFGGSFTDDADELDDELEEDDDAELAEDDDELDDDDDDDDDGEPAAAKSKAVDAAFVTARAIFDRRLCRPACQTVPLRLCRPACQTVQ